MKEYYNSDQKKVTFLCLNSNQQFDLFLLCLLFSFLFYFHFFLFIQSFPGCKKFVLGSERNKEGSVDIRGTPQTNTKGTASANKKKEYPTQTKKTRQSQSDKKVAVK
jgi:hypothetical protein